MNYRLTPQARRGFQGILEYVDTAFGPRVAARVLTELEAAFTRICEHPTIGHLREDITLDPSIRFWPVGPSLVAYRVRGNAVEILFVERGERDWAEFMTD